MMDNLLSIRNLTVTVKGTKILDDMSFDIGRSKIVGLVGGSGSGKTTAGLAILRLLADQLIIESGQIIFEGNDLLTETEQQIRQRRGAQIAMVFQEPLDAFDPLFTIGQQIDEVLSAHTDLTAAERHLRALEVLAQVQLPQPERILHSYPHQISGGQRQRAMIAQAIACSPKLLIADEPTSNLDVVAQAEIMDVFRMLRRDLGMSIILISHDLGMVAHVADEAIVLCAGKVVETGIARDIMARPTHGYTQSMVDIFR